MMSRKSVITDSLLFLVTATVTFMAMTSIALAKETSSLKNSSQTSSNQVFSIADWSQSFTSALKAKNSTEVLRLLDVKALEKSALACIDCSAKEKLEMARKLFAKKQFEKSLELYNQVPKNSPYWFEAVEEKGWNYYRQNDSEKALAQSKTLLSPQFAEVVGTEAYFLQSLTQLRICDYKGIFATHKMFKEKQKSRIVEVQKLAASGMNEAFAKIITSADQFPLVTKELGDSFLHLPTLYYKDLDLQSQLLRFKVSQKALEILKTQDSSMVKVQASLNKMNQDSFKKMKLRLALLAQKETKENSKIIQKLNLIEVEAIQRIHIDMALSKDIYSKGQFKQPKEDQLVFMDDGRPWIDELDKFEVAAKACPQDIRRKM